MKNQAQALLQGEWKFDVCIGVEKNGKTHKGKTDQEWHEYEKKRQR